MQEVELIGWLHVLIMVADKTVMRVYAAVSSTWWKTHWHPRLVLRALQKHELQPKRPLALSWDHDWCVKMKIVITLSASKMRPADWASQIHLTQSTLTFAFFTPSQLSSFKLFTMMAFQCVQKTIKSLFFWSNYWVTVEFWSNTSF